VWISIQSIKLAANILVPGASKTQIQSKMVSFHCPTKPKSLALLLFLASFLSSLELVIGQDKGIFMPDPATLIYLPQVNVTLKNQFTGVKHTLIFPNVAITSSPTKENVTIDITLGTAEPAVAGTTATGITLKLEIKKQRGYWLLKNAFMSGTVGIDKESTTLKDNGLYSSMELTAPLPRSYHCGKFGPFFPKVTAEEKKKSNITASIQLLDFQFQTFMKNGTFFGPSYDCVGFFSIGILSGIFITIMLIAIISWALSMIMSVNTMDRFDDPKGKSISFAGTE